LNSFAVDDDPGEHPVEDARSSHGTTLGEIARLVLWTLNERVSC
jgi:hypothetical protein